MRQPASGSTRSKTHKKQNIQWTGFAISLSGFLRTCPPAPTSSKCEESKRTGKERYHGTQDAEHHHPESDARRHRRQNARGGIENVHPCLGCQTAGGPGATRGFLYEPAA